MFSLLLRKGSQNVGKVSLHPVWLFYSLRSLSNAALKTYSDLSMLKSLVWPSLLFNCYLFYEEGQQSFSFVRGHSQSTQFSRGGGIVLIKLYSYKRSIVGGKDDKRVLICLRGLWMTPNRFWSNFLILSCFENSSATRTFLIFLVPNQLKITFLKLFTSLPLMPCCRSYGWNQLLWGWLHVNLRVKLSTQLDIFQVHA